MGNDNKDLSDAIILKQEAEFLSQEAAIALAEKEEAKAFLLLRLAATKYRAQWDKVQEISNRLDA